MYWILLGSAAFIRHIAKKIAKDSWHQPSQIKHGSSLDGPSDLGDLSGGTSRAASNKAWPWAPMHRVKRWRVVAAHSWGTGSFRGCSLANPSYSQTGPLPKQHSGRKCSMPYILSMMWHLSSSSQSFTSWWGFLKSKGCSHKTGDAMRGTNFASIWKLLWPLHGQQGYIRCPSCTDCEGLSLAASAKHKQPCSWIVTRDFSDERDCWGHTT